jgi:hypothetical protein
MNYLIIMISGLMFGFSETRSWRQWLAFAVSLLVGVCTKELTK